MSVYGRSLNYLLMWQAGLLRLVPGRGRHLHHTALTASGGVGRWHLSLGRRLMLLLWVVGWHIGGYTTPLHTVVRRLFIVVVDDRHTLEAEKTHTTHDNESVHARVCAYMQTTCNVLLSVSMVAFLSGVFCVNCVFRKIVIILSLPHPPHLKCRYFSWS